ncbi:MAG: tRNA (guanosine(46)-N7)-methyltransferase TrmB [Pseudomonadota bacterium]
MTRAQARALETLSERYCLESGDGPLDPVRAFGRSAPLGLEIGYGMGQALLEWARERPDWNLLGVEVYQPGVGSALLGIEREALENVRLVEGPAEQLVEARLPPESLDEVRIFFPDPWPKKRHHKRRLIQSPFVATLAERLRPGALLWVATDWEPYAEWIVEVLDAEPSLIRQERETAPARPRTRFESRGLARGHRVWDLRYQRKRSSTESR